MKKLLCFFMLMVAGHVYAYDKEKIFLDQIFWGEWQVINSKDSCIEKYQFSKPGLFTYQVKEKKLTGEFVVLRSNDKKKLDQLILDIQTDNNAKGCSGELVNYEGKKSGFFLKWISPSSAELCVDNVGKSCTGLYFNRK